MIVQNANLTFKNLLSPLLPSRVKYIVVHHIEAECATPQDIHRWHLNNGWSGAGYNEYIRKDGSVYILRGDKVGSHALGYNEISYGIALEGNYQYRDTVTAAQMESLVNRIKYHKTRFNANVVKHSQICSTSCPGLKFPWSVLVAKLKGEEMDVMDIKKELGIKDASWAKGEIQKAIANGLISSEHDPNEPVTFGLMMTVINNLYNKIK